MTGAILVTEVKEVGGLDVPVEALTFHPGGECVIYSRLLIEPKALLGISANVDIDALFFKAVLN